MAAAGSITGDKTLVPGQPSGGSKDSYRVSAGLNPRYIPTGVYNLLDNSIVTGNGEAGMDFGAGSTHPLATLRAWDHGNPEAPEPRGSFGFAVWNPNVTATLRPHREDSFILLSPGRTGCSGRATTSGTSRTTEDARTAADRERHGERGIARHGRGARVRPDFDSCLFCS